MATTVRFSARRAGAKAAPRTKFNAAGARAGVRASGGGSKPSGAQWASIRDSGGGGSGLNRNSTWADIPD